MKATHTKGKWRFIQIPGTGLFEISSNDTLQEICKTVMPYGNNLSRPQVFEEAEANAEMIVKAVNTFPLLVKSLTYVTEQLEKHSTQLREMTTKNKKGYAEIDVDVLAFILQDIANGTKAALKSATE